MHSFFNSTKLKLSCRYKKKKTYFLTTCSSFSVDKLQIKEISYCGHLCVPVFLVWYEIQTIHCNLYHLQKGIHCRTGKRLLVITQFHCLLLVSELQNNSRKWSSLHLTSKKNVIGIIDCKNLQGHFANPSVCRRFFPVVY